MIICVSQQDVIIERASDEAKSKTNTGEEPETDRPITINSVLQTRENDESVP